MSRPDPSFLLSAGVDQAVQRVPAVAFGNKRCWFESHYRHISLCSQGSWTRVNSSLRKQTVLVRVPLSAYFFMQPKQFERMLAPAFGNKLCWFESHYRHISLCSPGSWKRVSSSLRKQTVLVRVPLSAYFFMQPKQFERVLAPAFGNKLCWFESHYRHISLCSPGSWKRVSSSLRKQTMLVRVPLSAYFFT